MPHLNAHIGAIIVRRMAATIDENAAYLSELDGAIGDGDHGINMRKGFNQAAAQLTDGMPLSDALQTLGMTLIGNIGGSMGPLYGSLFMGMSASLPGTEVITGADFEQMLAAGLENVRDLSEAQVGDKTLMDTLIPAVTTFEEQYQATTSFADALTAMKHAAEAGMDSTRDLVSQVGRSSRLGDRSVGHLDAGAVSCWLLLSSLADTVLEHLVSA